VSSFESIYHSPPENLYLLNSQSPALISIQPFMIIRSKDVSRQISNHNYWITYTELHRLEHNCPHYGRPYLLSIDETAKLWHGETLELIWPATATKKKVFLTLTPGPNVAKLFFFRNL
jgi:hypothetical protein